MYQCIYIVRNIKEIFVFVESQNETTVKKILLNMKMKCKHVN